MVPLFDASRRLLVCSLPNYGAVGPSPARGQHWLDGDADRQTDIGRTASPPVASLGGSLETKSESTSSEYAIKHAKLRLPPPVIPTHREKLSIKSGRRNFR